MTKNIAAINQMIMEKFVRQNVYYNVTNLVTDILRCDSDRWEDVKSIKEDNGEDIFQWLAVSEFLKEKLYEKGEYIFEDEYWGRQTAGQAVYMDKVIYVICNDEEILCTQQYSWEREV